MSGGDPTGRRSDDGATERERSSRRPEDLRAGDSDREAVAEILRTALGEGRLELSEVDERLARVYAAKTYGELEPLVADLPGTLPWQHRPARGPADDEKPLHITAGWSSEKRTGAWRVPSRIVAEASMSDVKLDFREVTTSLPRIDLEIKGGMGSVVLVLPEGWSVDTEELRSAWGTVKNRHHAEAAPGRPTILVTGSIGMGTFKTRGPYFYE